MSTELLSRSRQLLLDLELAYPSDDIRAYPLRGGVASDIARVEAAGRTYCVKFALEKLRVAEDWRAPVHRNKAEYAWLKFAGEVVPDAVPLLFGQSGEGFAMEYVSAPDVRLWKDMLLNGPPNDLHARSVARVLARIHSESAQPGFQTAAFENQQDFLALRVDPYLLFTAGLHPDLASALQALADQLLQSRLALVHGDVSPKNILIRCDQPILLDAECATVGDPSFDVAFCLNHLLLKSVHLPEYGNALIRSARIFWDSYAPSISWEAPSKMEARVAGLLPALMLARVDGKSPVEYLSDRNQKRVRNLSRHILFRGPDCLDDVLESVFLANESAYA